VFTMLPMATVNNI